MGVAKRTAFLLLMVGWLGVSLDGCFWAFDVWPNEPPGGENESLEDELPVCNAWPAVSDTILIGGSQSAAAISGALFFLALLGDINAEESNPSDQNLINFIWTSLGSMVVHSIASICFVISGTNAWHQYRSCTEEQNRILLKWENKATPVLGPASVPGADERAGAE